MLFFVQEGILEGMDASRVERRVGPKASRKPPPVAEATASEKADGDDPLIKTIVNNNQQGQKTRQRRTERDDRWVIRFKELQKFRDENGHCLVPKDFQENPKLGRWVQNQRLQYKLREEGKPNRMSTTRMQRLMDLGFQWRMRDQWIQRFHELEAFYKLHKHCNIPRRYPPNPSLGHYVAKQRFQYKLYREGKPNSMTPERIQMLERLNFDWNVLEAAWMDRYRELVEYSNKHGNCCVPESAMGGLGVWVSNQRAQFKKWVLNPQSCKITQRRIDLLNEIAFEWNVRDAAWMDHFVELGNFVKQNGIGIWPERNTFLYEWLSLQTGQGPDRLARNNRWELLWLLGFPIEPATRAAEVAAAEQETNVQEQKSGDPDYSLDEEKAHPDRDTSKDTKKLQMDDMEVAVAIAGLSKQLLHIQNNYGQKVGPFGISSVSSGPSGAGSRRAVDVMEVDEEPLEGDTQIRSTQPHEVKEVPTVRPITGIVKLRTDIGTPCSDGEHAGATKRVDLLTNPLIAEASAKSKEDESVRHTNDNSFTLTHKNVLDAANKNQIGRSLAPSHGGSVERTRAKTNIVVLECGGHQGQS